jgi:hypothetical protein
MQASCIRRVYFVLREDEAPRDDVLFEVVRAVVRPVAGLEVDLASAAFER